MNLGASLENVRQDSKILTSSSMCHCACHERDGHAHPDTTSVVRNVTCHVSHRGEKMLPDTFHHYSRPMSPRSRSVGPRRRGLGAVSPPRQMSLSPTNELEMSARLQASQFNTNFDVASFNPLRNSQILSPLVDVISGGNVSSKSGDMAALFQSGPFSSFPPPQSSADTVDGKKQGRIECQSPPLQSSTWTADPLLPNSFTPTVSCLNCKMFEQQLNQKTLELNYFRQRKSLLESQIDTLHHQIHGLEEKSPMKVDQQRKEEVKLLLKEKELWDDIMKKASEMGLYERKVLLEMQSAIQKYIEYDKKMNQIRLEENCHLIASLQETIHHEKKLRQDIVSETEVRLISENADLVSSLRAKETALSEEISKNEKCSANIRQLERQVKELENMAVQTISWQLIADVLDVEEKEILSSSWCDLPNELKEKLNTTETIREYLQESEFLDVTDDIIQCLWYRYRCTQKAFNALKQRLENLGISQEDDWETLAEIDNLLYAKDREILALKEEKAIFRDKCEELKLNFQQKLEAALFERNRLQLQIDQSSSKSLQNNEGHQNGVENSEHVKCLERASYVLQKAYDFMDTSNSNYQLKRKLELLQTALDSTPALQSLSTSVEELLNIENIDQLRQKCILLFNTNREMMSSNKEMEQKMKDMSSLDSGEQYRASLMEYKLEAAEEAYRAKLKERDDWINSLENKMRDLEMLNDDLKSRLERERKDREQNIVDKNVDLQLHSRYGSYMSVGLNEPLWQEERQIKVSGRQSSVDRMKAHRDYQEEVPSREFGILKSPQKHALKQKTEKMEATDEARLESGRSHDPSGLKIKSSKLQDSKRNNNTGVMETASFHNVHPNHNLEDEATLSSKLLEDKYIFTKLRKCSSHVETAMKELSAEVDILEKHSVLDLGRLKHSAHNLKLHVDDERNHLYDDLRRMLEELRHEKERSQTLSEKKREFQNAFVELRRRFGSLPQNGMREYEIPELEDVRTMKEALENSQRLLKNLKKRHMEEKQNLTSRIHYYTENEKVISHTLQKLQEEVSFSGKQVTLLKQENERLTNEHHEQEKMMWRERESFERQLDSQRNAFDDLQREFKVKCGEALHLQEELVTTKVECRSLQSEINNLTYKLTGEQNAVKQMNGKMADMNSQLSSSKRRLASQKDELERVNNYRRRLKELSQARVQAESDLKCVLTEKDHLAQQLDWMKERWNDLEQQLQQEKSSHITLKARNEGMEEEIEWLRSQLQHAKTKCNLDSHLQDPKTRADIIQGLIRQSHNKAQVLLQTDIELPNFHQPVEEKM